MILLIASLEESNMTKQKLPTYSTDGIFRFKRNIYALLNSLFLKILMQVLKSKHRTNTN